MTSAESISIETRFQDLHPALSGQAAVVEANRCLNCFEAPCMSACPTHIDIPGFIKKIARDNLRGSALRILEANVLGLSCSRVCPVDVLCEGSCVMHGRGERPIAIGLLQRHAMEHFYHSGAQVPWKPAVERPQRVACIGAGPASLACAAALRREGFAVTIFEKRAVAGGLNSHGVAEYKLQVSDSLREVKFIQSLGVGIETGKSVGDDISLQQIEHEFDVIFLGVGLGEGNLLNPSAEDAPQIIDALRYIEAYKMRAPLPTGARVVVIGGGNTAIDAACAAKLLGADDVTIAYRRGEEEMPAFTFEIEHAREKRVRFLFQAAPVALKSGAVEFQRMRLTGPDASGRRKSEPEPGTEFNVPCDTVIPAIGQSKLTGLLEQVANIKLNNGSVVIDSATGRTSNPKYFAGGDCVSGGREVVDAVADGKRAAQGIVEAFGG
jgi:dihydropyrimidine dehydrogenase (NAD+) subunit PreT